MLLKNIINIILCKANLEAFNEAKIVYLEGTFKNYYKHFV